MCVCVCVHVQCTCMSMYSFMSVYDMYVWVWFVGTDIAQPTIPFFHPPYHNIICALLCVFSPLTSSTPSIPKPACTGGGVLTCQGHYSSLSLL